MVDKSSQEDMNLSTYGQPTFATKIEREWDFPIEEPNHPSDLDFRMRHILVTKLAKKTRFLVL